MVNAPLRGHHPRVGFEVDQGVHRGTVLGRHFGGTTGAALPRTRISLTSPGASPEASGAAPEAKAVEVMVGSLVKSLEKKIRKSLNKL